MTSGRPKVRLDQQERVAVITLHGDVDLHDLTEVTGTFTQALSDISTDATLIGLSEVTFADSTFLNQLLQAFSEHTAQGRPLVLTGPLHSAVERLLQITGTDSILPLARTAQEGLRQLQAASLSTVRDQGPEVGI
ncbi:STAS domain-containing protein [Streptomyces sp. NPDC051218]|uniref:STAS domain-containing protein n=1 Tax=Streptomyces sp. NPDC051218 TaxID=3365645 RepID=UPI0037A47513